MRYILLLDVFTTATGTSKGQDMTSIDHGVDQHTHAGLRGLSSLTWQKIPGRAQPFIAKHRDEGVAPKVHGKGQEDTTTTEPLRGTRNKPSKKRVKGKDRFKKGERTPEVKASIATTAEKSATPVPTAPTTSLTTIQEIFVWPADVTATPEAATTLCPPHYGTTTTYEIGDTIEANSRIYRCQSTPRYCNIHQLDDSWSDAEKDLWRDAWLLVGDCEREALVGEHEAIAAEAPVVTVEVAAGTTGTVASATGAPVAAEAPTTAAPITPETTQLPPCPADYDMAKTTYVAGEDTTVSSRIFRCREVEGYERYCNTAVWHESLLDENEKAHEMWLHAWEELGPCLPTQEELMRAEAAADDGDA